MIDETTSLNEKQATDAIVPADAQPEAQQDAQPEAQGEEQPVTIRPCRRLSELEDEEQKNLVKFQIEKKKYYAKEQWYALYVTPGHEYQIFDYLNGVDEKEARKIRRGKARREDLKVHIDPEKVIVKCFIASIREHVKYSDRMIWKERIQTPGLVFVYCDLDHREPIFHSPISEHVTGFLSDRTHHRPLAISGEAMQTFMEGIDGGYAFSIEKPTFTIGQRVLIIDGAAKGHTAELVGTKEVISRKEYETDRTGKTILDSEGNPIPKHRITLQLRFNSLMAAQFEVDSDKVILAPKDQPDFVVLD